MIKQLAFISLFLFPLISFSQPIPNQTASDGRMGYEADGLDMWDLDGQNPEIALQNFKTKCDSEIPSRITARFPYTGIDPNDFTFASRVDQTYVRGYGTSYRCYIHAIAKEGSSYKFTRWQATDMFYDIRDQDGNVTTTAVDQCKQSVEDIELNTEDLKMFDRHALYIWAKDRNGTPYVASCYVTFITLVKK